jgi:hypothetical protein
MIAAGAAEVAARVPTRHAIFLVSMTIRIAPATSATIGFLLRLLKAPPQTRDQLKAERAKARAIRTRRKRSTVALPAPQLMHSLTACGTTRFPS